MTLSGIGRPASPAYLEKVKKPPEKPQRPDSTHPAFLAFGDFKAREQLVRFYETAGSEQGNAVIRPPTFSSFFSMNDFKGLASALRRGGGYRRILAAYKT